MHLRNHPAIVVLLTAGFVTTVAAQNLLAPTPPMGWNSWDSFGTTVTEEEVKANADYMARNLKSHGWEYVIVDIQWSEQHPKSHGYRPDADLAMDANGRLIRSASRSPSISVPSC